MEDLEQTERHYQEQEEANRRLCGGDGEFLRRAEELEEVHDASMAKKLQKGPTRVMELTVEMKPVRGKCIMRMPPHPEFEISFMVKLNSIPTSGNKSLLHMSSNGDPLIEIPHIQIVKSTTQLMASVRCGSVNVVLYGDEQGIPLHRAIEVRFKYNGGLMSLESCGHISETLGDNFEVPMGIKIHVFVGSPILDPADATVSEIIYRKLATGYRKGSGSVISFELPPAEKRQLDEAQKEIIQNKRWTRFDTFFGAILMLNSIVIGFQAVKDKEDYWFWVNALFLFLFILELALRIIIMFRIGSQQRKPDPDKQEGGSGSGGRKSDPGRQDEGAVRLDPLQGVGYRRTCCLIITDRWILFDAFAICIGGLDLYLDLLDASLPFNVTVVRCIRLLRLAKMVRLLRAFRELGILVEGVIMSFQTLFWTFVLLLVVTYIAGIMIARTEQFLSEETQELHNLERTSSAMWQLCKLVTLDNWTAIIFSIMKEGSVAGYAICAFLLMYTAVTAVGMLNMVVGVMCHTAFGLDEKLRRMKKAEEVLSKGRQLNNLRTKLKSYGQRPLFKNDKYLAPYELLEATQQDPHISALAKSLELTTKDVVQLVYAFEENGTLEIDGIIEAMGTIELQRYYGTVSRDAFGDSQQKGGMRPVDMVFFSFCNKELESLINITERNLMSICTLAYDSMSILQDRAYQAYTMLKQHGSKVVRRQVPDRRFQKPGITISDLCKHSRQSHASAAEAKLSVPMDAFFGFFIVLNGLSVGLEMVWDPKGGEATVFQIMNLMFTFVFIIEFALRAVLFTDLLLLRQESQKQWSATTGSSTSALKEDAIISSDMMERVEDLQRNMRLSGMLPPLPPGGPLQVLCNLPTMLKDPASLFDFCVVLFCTLDNLIFDHIQSSDVNLSAVSTARTFRLLRLTRLMRALRVFPKLQMLMSALVSSWRILVSIILTLLLALYSVGVFMVAHVGAVVDEDSPLKSYYDSIDSAALTGWQVVTFDHWADVIHDLLDEGFVLPCILLFALVFLVGLGLLKMAIGVLCGCAINLQRVKDKDTKHEGLLEFLTAMQDFQQLCDKELGSQMVPKEVFEQAFKIPFRSRKTTEGSLTQNKPRLSVFADHEEDPSYSGVSSNSLSKTFKVIQSEKFAIKLMKILERAKLSPAICKQVFEKVDYLRTGYVSVDGFARGALCMKEDLTKIDIFACSVGLRSTRSKFVEAGELLQQMHWQVEGLLEDMSDLVHRKGGANPGRHKAVERASHRMVEELHVLSTTATKALDHLQRVDENGLPEMEARGKAHVVRGQGFLKWDRKLEMFIGKDSSFRSEIMQGDILIWEVEQNAQHQAAVVTAVLAQERLRVHGMDQLKIGQALNQWVPFMVSRSSQDQVYVQGPAEGEGMYAPRHTIEAQLTPRSAAQMLDWEIATRERESGQLIQLRQERQQLQLQIMDLEKELLLMSNRTIVMDTFHEWKEICKLKRTLDKEMERSRQMRDSISHEETAETSSVGALAEEMTRRSSKETANM